RSENLFPWPPAHRLDPAAPSLVSTTESSCASWRLLRCCARFLIAGSRFGYAQSDLYPDSFSVRQGGMRFRGRARLRVEERGFGAAADRKGEHDLAAAHYPHAARNITWPARHNSLQTRYGESGGKFSRRDLSLSQRSRFVRSRPEFRRPGGADDRIVSHAGILRFGPAGTGEPIFDRDY